MSNQTYLRKLNPERCAQLAVMGKTITLAQFGKDSSLRLEVEEKLDSWTWAIAEFVDLKRPLEDDDERVSIITEVLFQEYPDATLEDYYVYLRSWIAGKYGPTYHSLNGILENFATYMKEKRSRIQRLHNEQAQREQQAKAQVFRERMKDPEQRKAYEERVAQKFKDFWANNPNIRDANLGPHIAQAMNETKQASNS